MQKIKGTSESGFTSNESIKDTSACMRDIGVVTRFNDEMLFSQIIRARRLGASIDVAGKCVAPESFAIPWNVRHPLHLLFSMTVKPEEEELAYEAIEDGTLWPIELLLSGLDISLLVGRPIWRDLEREYFKNLWDERVRFCNECANEQRDDFGISWWAKSHNLPLVTECHKHRTPLYWAPTHNVWYGRGRLPHECLRLSFRIGEKSTESTHRIAKRMMKLSASAALMDTAIFNQNVLYSNPFRRWDRIDLPALKFYSSVGMIHPRFGHAVSGSRVDSILKIVALGNEHLIDDVVRQSTIERLPLFSEKMGQDALEGIIGHGLHWDDRCPTLWLAQRCQHHLDMYQYRIAGRGADYAARIAPKYCAALAISYSLLPEYARIWHREKWSAFGFSELTQLQHVKALYVIRESIRKWNYGRRPRRPDLNILTRADQPIAAWGQSFLRACQHGLNF